MKVLLIGSGGREHALAWKIKRSELVSRLYCAPGNPGISDLAEIVPIKATEIVELKEFARAEGIDLTVVGPEQPLTDGIVDVFTTEGLNIFGPSKAAAEIEGSKVFAKHFMRKYRIPTAEFKTFDIATRFDAERYINEIPAPIVVKVDGLAAGKGVAVCETKEDALAFLDSVMERRTFGDAGMKIVIEEFLVGEEASVFIITDGQNYVPLASAQDHKRIFDNDLGKNTGGMGAYAPAPVVGEGMMATIERTIIRPTLAGMANEGRPYRGCLYIGLMITETGPKVVEFNCRFGDPETQVVLPVMEDDLVKLMVGASTGNLDGSSALRIRHTAVCVVIASGGYPDAFETGKPIVGLDAPGMEEGVLVFHAGTRREKNTIVTAGGRVLGVTAVGPANDLEGAIDKAYRTVMKITFDGAYYRSDIGKKGLLRLRQPGEGASA